jgi:hypothetical protein
MSIAPATDLAVRAAHVDAWRLVGHPEGRCRCRSRTLKRRQKSIAIRPGDFTIDGGRSIDRRTFSSLAIAPQAEIESTWKRSGSIRRFLSFARVPRTSN